VIPKNDRGVIFGSAELNKHCSTTTGVVVGSKNKNG
jgi:hypothetical protein